MKQIILLLIFALLQACSVNPTVVTRPDGTVVASTGGSIFSNSTAEGGEIKMPNGTTISYFKQGKDETTGVVDIAKGKFLLEGTKALSSDALSAHKTTEGTTRVINGNATSVKLGKQAADVEKLRILNPVEVAPVAP